MSIKITAENIVRYIKYPPEIFVFLQRRCNFKVLPDKTYLEVKYRSKFGKKLDWDNPQTFNEKLQWLKMHDRKPIYSTMVDKYEAKKYVAERIGEEYIIPTYGVWDRFDDIDFDALPDQFVLKCTHDCGGLVIVKDKKNFDKEAARKKINKAMKRNYYYRTREWPYKNVKPRVLAEKYMEDPKTAELRDYKFFTFHGIVKSMFIATERNSSEETKFDFFDADFEHLHFTNGHPNAAVCPEKPERFEEMKCLAEKLSTDIPHLRVDFYEVDGRIYFGELTFFHWNGFTLFEPKEWDKTFGDWIQL